MSTEKASVKTDKIITDFSVCETLEEELVLRETRNLTSLTI